MYTTRRGFKIFVEGLSYRLIDFKFSLFFSQSIWAETRMHAPSVPVVRTSGHSLSALSSNSCVPRGANGCILWLNMNLYNPVCLYSL